MLRARKPRPDAIDSGREIPSGGGDVATKTDRLLATRAGASAAGFRKLSELRDPMVLKMLEYWTAKRGDRSMPTPQDMNPTEFPRYLPNLLLLQVDHEPFGLTYRLMGEEAVQANGGNFRGRSVSSLDEIKPHFGSMLFEFYKWIATARRPTGAGGNMEFAGRGHMVFEAVYLPLSLDGERTDRILGVTSYRSVSATERLRDEIAAI